MRHCSVGLLSLLLNILATAEGNIKLAGEIVKPKKDKREYRGLTLKNGIKTVLISDPKTDKAAAALSVHVGYLSDPKEIPGMAHFCEHMLFMGTKKFPEESYYQKFLTKHGGLFNAGTNYDYTTYFFDIAADYLDQTLDVFSQFFISPLFSKSSVDRETNAVNSEYYLKIRQDGRRVESVYAAISDPGHDFTKFGVGSRETLYDIPKSKGMDPRAEVMKFWQKWYSSNIMTLAILGKEPLDKLQEYAVKYFSAIENKKVKTPSWTNPFVPAAAKHWVDIETLQETNDIIFVFPTTDFNALYKTKPDAYVRYILGYSGSGSLKAWLKQKGWIESLSVNMQTIATGFGKSMIRMKLTNEGEKHIEEIGKALFQCLNMIRKQGPQKRIFDERQKLHNLEFENKERIDPINFVAMTAIYLNYYKTPEILEGDYKLFEYSPKEINKLLESLTPDNMFIVRLSDKFDESSLDKFEPRYNVSYSVKPIKESLMKAFKNPGTNKYFKLPSKNEYIPDNTSLRPRDKDMGKIPELIKSNDLMQVWYHQDNDYKVPKGYAWIKLISPVANVDPFHAFKRMNLVALLNDALAEPLAPATEAGLGYDVHSDRQGLTIKVSGYPEKQETLVKNIIKQITTFKVNPTRFNNLHKALVRHLKNFNVQPGVDQAIVLFAELTSQNDWSPEQMVKTADDVTPARLEDYLKMLLSQLHIDVFGSGNYERKDVLAIAKVVEEAFKKDIATVPLEAAAVEGVRRVNLYSGETALFQKIHPVDFNTALFDYFECDVSNLRNDLLTGLLGQIIHQPMFEQLRTVEQLGYDIRGVGLELEGLVGFVGVISSGRSPDFLEQRFDSFLTDLAAGLTNLTEEDFDKEKEALATKRFEKPKQLEAKSAEFWKEIWQGLYNFDRKELEKPILKKITLKEFTDLFDKCINPKSDKRRRLNVWMIGTKARATGYKLDSACNDKAKCVSDITEFVKQHPLAPRPKPFQTLKEIEAKCPRNCRSPGQ